MHGFQFNPGESASLLRLTRRLVESAIRRRSSRVQISSQLSEIPVSGLFVTLRNGGRLRACMGAWHGLPPGLLGSSLPSAARSAAIGDHRCPPILESELSDLRIELSLLHNPRSIDSASGAARITAIEVGRHGLLVADAAQTGLLLPQVAVDHGWNARTFLDHTALKAGLRKNAWRSPKVRLTTFEAVKLAEDPDPEPPAR